MKKVYGKPRIKIENFALCTNIAGNCTYITKNPTEASFCGYLDERDPTGVIVFTSGIDNCARHEDDGDYNGICYHIPSEAKDVFNS